MDKRSYFNKDSNESYTQEATIILNKMCHNIRQMLLEQIEMGYTIREAQQLIMEALWDEAINLRLERRDKDE